MSGAGSPDLGALEREARADAALWRRRAEEALDAGDVVKAAYRHRHALGCERQAEIAAMLAAGENRPAAEAAANDNGAGAARAGRRDGLAAAAYGIAGAVLGAAGTAALCLGFSG